MHFTIIIFCLIGLFTFTTTFSIRSIELNQQLQEQQLQFNKQQQLERDKRDLFATTGWGAGGGSYSTFYITGKQVKEMQAAQQNKNAKTNTDSSSEIVEVIQCENCGTTKRNVKKGKETIPQLFSSNGWGPLG